MVHFWAFFVLSEAEETDIAHKIFYLQNSLISLFFVFSEAEKWNLKMVHFWAFFVFSEADETDIAHNILGSKNRLLEAEKWKNSHFGNSFQK